MPQEKGQEVAQGNIREVSRQPKPVQHCLRDTQAPSIKVNRSPVQGPMGEEGPGETQCELKIF